MLYLQSVKSCLLIEFQMSSVMTSVYKNMEKNGPSVLFVPKNNTKSTKSSLEGFSWDATIGEMQGRAPGLLDFIYAVRVVLLKIY